MGGGRDGLISRMLRSHGVACYAVSRLTTNSVQRCAQLCNANRECSVSRKMRTNFDAPEMIGNCRPNIVPRTWSLALA